MARLKVFNPVAESMQFRADPAPRLQDLNGKRIGLYWNMKVGGDTALARVEERLRERYPQATFHPYQGAVSAVARHASAAQIEQITRECDAVIGTTSD